MPPMFVELLQPGDVFHHRMPGGGGFGNAFERDPEATALDVRDGKVSRSAARELYGVVIEGDGAVNEQATSRLRRERVG
jgi:N-methylhydantoinase B/oxoprolinase/acetone carboxylase alpha subunit